VEEVIVKRAAKKLKVDHLIMQKTNQSKLSYHEMKDAIHCGAQEIIVNGEQEINEQSVEDII
jgi:hypothetical protein